MKHLIMKYTNNKTFYFFEFSGLLIGPYDFATTALLDYFRAGNLTAIREGGQICLRQ